MCDIGLRIHSYKEVKTARVGCEYVTNAVLDTSTLRDTKLYGLKRGSNALRSSSLLGRLGMKDRETPFYCDKSKSTKRRKSE